MTKPRRGGILFEVMLSLALFVGAAAVTIGTVRNVMTALERAAREQQAVDLARSRMAELEAGLINLNDLRDGSRSAIGSFEGFLGDEFGRGDDWTVAVSTERTEYPGLTLVAITVRDAGADEDRPGAVGFTLRQLLRLGDEDELEFEEDDLFDGFEPGPTGEEPR